MRASDSGRWGRLVRRVDTSHDRAGESIYPLPARSLRLGGVEDRDVPRRRSVRRDRDPRSAVVVVV